MEGPSQSEEPKESLPEGATEDREEPAKESPLRPPFYVELAGVIGLPVIVLVLAWSGVWLLSTAVFLIGLGFIPYGLWLGRRTNTIYTIFLGCMLAALLTATYCLWIEMGRYGFEVKPRKAKLRFSFLPPASPSTACVIRFGPECVC